MGCGALVKVSVGKHSVCGLSPVAVGRESLPFTCGDSGVKVNPEVCGQSRQLQRYAACVPRMWALASLGLD